MCTDPAGSLFPACSSELAIPVLSSVSQGLWLFLLATQYDPRTILASEKLALFWAELEVGLIEPRGTFSVG
jgi:hypothetical protein